MTSVHAVLQGKWDSLCEAGEAYSELSQYARKEKQWLLQRVGFQFSLHTCAEPRGPLFLMACMEDHPSVAQLLSAQHGYVA